MKQLLVGALLVFLGFGRLCAGDWLPWQVLGGKQFPAHAGTVEIRFRHDETGDDRQKGYFLRYELRNGSATQVAKVSLAFAWQNPQSLQWEDASIDRATITEIGPGASSTAGSIYSPEANGIDHGAFILWQDGFTAKPEK